MSRGHAVRHWKMQRISSVALIPLTLWFVGSLVAHVGQGQVEVQAWLRQPLPIMLMTVLILVTFYHLALGVRVVIEDYIADPRRQAFFIGLLYLASIALALISLAALGTIGLGR